MFLYYYYYYRYLGVCCSGGDTDVTKCVVLRREAAGSRDAIVGGFGLLVSTAGGFGLLGSAAGNVSLLTTGRWWWLLSEPFDRADFCIRGEFTKEFFCFCIFFWRARMCLPLLCLRRHFVFLRDVWIRTQKAAFASRRSYQLSHPSPSLASHKNSNRYCFFP